MEALTALITSIVLFFTTTIPSVITGNKPAQPTPSDLFSPKNSDNNPYEAKPSVAVTPRVTPVPTTVPTKSSSSVVKTPSVNVSGEGWTVTARPGEKIKISTIVAMKGTTNTKLEFPPSDVPSGITFTTDGAPNWNIYLNVASSAKPGNYSFRQKFVSTSTNGVASGDLSMGITLTVLSK